MGFELIAWLRWLLTVLSVAFCPQRKLSKPHLKCLGDFLLALIVSNGKPDGILANVRRV